MTNMTDVVDEVEVTQPHYYYTGFLTTTNNYSQSISKDDISNTIRIERKLFKSTVIEFIR